MMAKKPWSDRKQETLAGYQRRRKILIAALGGECITCGSTHNLEFHHTHPREWVAAKLNRWQRMAMYERDWEDGVLELLCGHCNKVAGQPLPADYVEVPF